MSDDQHDDSRTDGTSATVWGPPTGPAQQPQPVTEQLSATQSGPGQPPATPLVTARPARPFFGAAAAVVAILLVTVAATRSGEGSAAAGTPATTSSAQVAQAGDPAPASSTPAPVEPGPALEPCVLTDVAGTMRDRASVSPDGLLTVGAARLDCDTGLLGLYSLTVALDDAPGAGTGSDVSTSDDTAVFVTGYDGFSAASTLPVPTDNCQAVVLFAGTEVTQPTAADLREQVLTWVESDAAKEGTTTVWTDSPTTIVAVTTPTSLDRCRDDAVRVPVAKKGDCWQSDAETGVSRKVSCSSAHNSEVLFVRSVGLVEWRTAHPKKSLPSSGQYATWMQKRASAICSPKFGAVRLTGAVSIKKLTARTVYPVDYNSFDTARKKTGTESQVVCVVRLKSETATTERKFLR